MGTTRRTGRVTSFRGLAAGFLVVATGLAAIPPAQAAPPAVATMSAGRALDQLERDFFDAKTGLYAVTGDKYAPTASLWPTSQVLAGAIGVARRTHAPGDVARVRRIIGSLKHYLGPGGVYYTRSFPTRRYTDDNNWIALDLLDAYGLLHDPSYLATAERIFTYLVASWDARQGGGIMWGDGHTERPTVSTAPAITIGVRLAAITHRSYYRTWADRFYAWENSHLRGSDGLYWDHILADGSIDKDHVSYNQGVMIEANLAYAGLTHQSRYLREAQRIATASVAAFPGPWRSRGTAAAYDAILVHALADVNAARPGTVSMATATAYARWAWPAATASRSVRDEQALLEQAGYVNTVLALGH